MLTVGKYRHYKGNDYEVIGVATHSETREAMVVYRPLYGEGAAVLVGHHDFTTFRSAHCQSASPLKTLKPARATRSQSANWTGP